jgi:hypothetical protein
MIESLVEQIESRFGVPSAPQSAPQVNGVRNRLGGVGRV